MVSRDRSEDSPFGGKPEYCASVEALREVLAKRPSDLILLSNLPHKKGLEEMTWAQADAYVRLLPWFGEVVTDVVRSRAWFEGLDPGQAKEVFCLSVESLLKWLPTQRQNVLLAPEQFVAKSLRTIAGRIKTRQVKLNQKHESVEDRSDKNIPESLRVYPTDNRRLRILRRALRQARRDAKLSAHDRRLLGLRFWMECSYEQIKGTLGGTSANALRAQLCRCLAKLRKTLERDKLPSDRIARKSKSACSAARRHKPRKLVRPRGWYGVPTGQMIGHFRQMYGDYAELPFLTTP